MTVGQLVRARREAEGLSQMQLAQRLDISQPNIARLETGQQYPRDHGITVRIAAFLGIDAHELAERIGEEAKARGRRRGPKSSAGARPQRSGSDDRPTGHVIEASFADGLVIKVGLNRPLDKRAWERLKTLVDMNEPKAG